MALSDPNQAVFLAAKRGKYRNVKVICGSEKFDSKREYNRWCELKLMQDGGLISGLFRQTPFECVVNGEMICKYIADFEYIENGKRVVEDSKGVRTAVYRLKKKLVKACHGILIRES